MKRKTEAEKREIISQVQALRDGGMSMRAAVEKIGGFSEKSYQNWVEKLGKPKPKRKATRTSSAPSLMALPVEPISPDAVRVGDPLVLLVTLSTAMRILKERGQ